MSGQLERLLEEATRGQWEAWEDEFGWHVSGRREDVTGALSRDQEPDAHLIALAPDMARLLIDTFGRHAHQFDDEILERFAELEQRAAP